MHGIRRYLTFANVASAIALFVAISGVGAYASGLIGPNDIRDNAIRSRHVKNHSLKGKDLATKTVVRFGSPASPGLNGDGAGCVDGTPGGSQGVTGGATCGGGAGGAGIATARCHKGEHATGGGYQMDKRHALVTKSRPFPSAAGNTPTGWRVEAVELTTNESEKTTVTPYVICTNG
jgi:hypothetical protein